MPEKILIVDDDIDSLKLIGLMLQRHGYDVVAASSGTQALSKADNDRPSLIILDVMMPDMNGLEVCRRLRANPNTAPIPIIMFTAKTLIDDKVKGFEAGADDYLTKPTHPAELASRVKAILQRHAQKSSPTATDGKSEGAMIGVLGIKGGVGTTTVAVNLGAAMLQSRQNPLLADFRLGNGAIGLMLGQGRSHGMARVLSRPMNEINKDAIEGEIVTHASGLRALVSSARPREIQVRPTAEKAVAVAQLLKRIGQPLILDIGSGLNEINRALINELDWLLVVLEPNILAVSMARQVLSELENMKQRSKISLVVVIRAQSNHQVAWHEIEKMLNAELSAIIGSAPDLAYQSLENHLPMVLLQPTGLVPEQYLKLANEVKTRLKT